MKKAVFTRENPSYFRSDLACEDEGCGAVWQEEIYPLTDGGEVGVQAGEHPSGEQYVTLHTPRLTLLSREARGELAHLLATQLKTMAEAMLGHPLNGDTCVLVAGLGNPDLTPDAIGPYVVRGMTATRHLQMFDPAMYGQLGCCAVAGVSPLVMGQTGMESGELVRGVVDRVSPHLLVAVDALAAGSCQRLASTIQLSSGGISPGAGVGNHRMGIDEDTMGVPVLGIGVPTVVDSATLVYDALMQAGVKDEDISNNLREVLEDGRRLVVSPKDCDVITEVTCEILIRGIDLAFGVGDI